jgi:hypothetical protein
MQIRCPFTFARADGRRRKYLGVGSVSLLTLTILVTKLTSLANLLSAGKWITPLLQ